MIEGNERYPAGEEGLEQFELSQQQKREEVVEGAPALPICKATEGDVSKISEVTGDGNVTVVELVP